MCVITADFKGIPDQIVKSWKQSIVQLLQGHEDLEMTGEIRLVNHQEIEMVILEWWTWWRWLVHSPTAWKASHEDLKALTPIPNLIRKSPQTQVTCGWKRVLMHKHYNMFMHQYFLCFVTLLWCFDYRLHGLKFVCLFLHTFIHFFCYFWSIFSFLCVKNPKTT